MEYPWYGGIPETMFRSDIDVTGINKKSRNVIKYPDLESARCPVAHSDECPVLVYAMLCDNSDNDSTAAQESQENEEAGFSDDTHSRSFFPK